MHPLDFRILLSFARNAPTHGYAVLQALERNPDVPDLPYPANFYRRIRDLRDQGWLVEVDPRPSHLRTIGRANSSRSPTSVANRCAGKAAG